MYELKKNEMYLRLNLLGPGPRLMKKEFTMPSLTKIDKRWSRQQPYSLTTSTASCIQIFPTFLPKALVLSGPDYYCFREQNFPNNASMDCHIRHITEAPYKNEVTHLYL